MTTALFDLIRDELAKEFPADVSNYTYAEIVAHLKTVCKGRPSTGQAIIAISLYLMLLQNPGLLAHVEKSICEATINEAVNRAIDVVVADQRGMSALSDWRSWLTNADLERAVSELDDPENTTDRALRLIATRLRVPPPPAPLSVNDAIQIVAVFRICWGSGLGGLHAHPMVLDGLSQYVCAKIARETYERAIRRLCA